MPRPRPLLDFGPGGPAAAPRLHDHLSPALAFAPPPSYAAAHDDEEEKDAPPRAWYHYVPTCSMYSHRHRTGPYTNNLMNFFSLLGGGLLVSRIFVVTFLLLLAPHPSWLVVLINYHLRVLHDHWLFARHLAVSYALTLLAFSSLITIIVRDPGGVKNRRGRGRHGHLEPGGEQREEGRDVHVTQALLAGQEEDGEGEEEYMMDISSPGKWCRKCWAPKPPRTHQ